MLTYGYRIGVINSPERLKHTIDGTKLNIAGFGTFEQGQIIMANAQRAIAPAMSVLTITAPSAADLGVASTDKNVAVDIRVQTKSTSYGADSASDAIGHGKMYDISIVVDGSDTATQVAAKIRDLYANAKGGFVSNVYLPFEVSGATDKVIYTVNDSSLYFKDYVEFGTDDTVVKLAATTNVLGHEGNGQGKDLEASVRMSNGRNEGAYTVMPGEVPDVKAQYTEVNFQVNSPVSNGWKHHEGLAGGLTPGANVESSVQKYVLYFKENTDLMAGDAFVEDIIKWLLGSGNVTNATIIKADGTAAAGADANAQADDFIA